MSETYRVVIKGVKEGFTKEQVIRNLATLFRSTEQRIRTKFEAPIFLVKKGLDLQSTEKYISVVEKQGCICAIESESDLPENSITDNKITTKKEDVKNDSLSKVDVVSIEIQGVTQDSKTPSDLLPRAESFNDKHRNDVTQTSLNPAVSPPEWYYELRSSRLGPVSKEDIRKLISDGKLALDSRVWKKGLDEWIEITSPIIWKA